MAVPRQGPDELSVKEQQLESWEEKLAQRAQSLAETARTLQQRRAAVGPLATLVQQQGGRPPAKLNELLSADPMLSAPHVAQAVDQAAAARRMAVEQRLRAAQVWEEDLTRQTAALNAVLQGLVAMQKEMQAQLEQLARGPEPEPVLLVKQPEPVPLQAPKSPAQKARPPSISPVAAGLNNRVHHRAKLKVQVDFESDHNFFTGFSSDISEGGLFVATVNLQPLGSPVEVAFALPTGEQVVAKGVVRWIREASDQDATVQPGMGIQFEHLSEDARDAVHQFISQREPMFYTD
ncbi:MAG: TIGR02266 family protein [Deltaproteobacteria bacterium]|nr:TIGR02266 family protein [Deltaproteobacteria bacterium]